MVQISGPSSYSIDTTPVAQQANATDMPNGPSVMVGTDGEYYTVPATSYNTAIQQGWRLAAKEEQNQIAENQKKEEKVSAAEKEKEEHPGIEGLKQFGNEASFGVLSYIANKNRTPEEQEIEQAATERFNKQHPLIHYGASVAGFAAPLLIPGIGEAGEAIEGLVRGGTKVAEKGLIEGAAKEAVAKEAEISLTRKIAGTAANYSTQGAIYSSPMAATQLAYGDPEQAAETMVWGTGLSGVLGAAAGTIGAAAKGTVSSLGDMLGSKLAEKDATGLSHLDNILRNMLGISDKEAKKMTSNGQFPDRLEKLVKVADEEGILRATGETRNKLINNVNEDAGNKLGDIYKKLDGMLGEHDIQNPATGIKMQQEFQAAIQQKFPEIMNGDLHADKLKFANKLSNAMSEIGDEPSFTDVQKLGKSISKTQTDFDRESVNAEIARVAYGVVKNNLEESAQKIFNDGNLPELFPEYLNQKARYAATSTLADNINVFKGTGKIELPLKNIFGLGNIAKGFLAVSHPAAAIPMAGEMAFKAFSANKFGLLGKGVSYLRKVISNPETQDQLGGYMAKEGVNALQEHLGNIPSYLSGSKIVTRAIADANPYQHLIGDTTGLSKEQQYAKLTNAITRASVDVGLTAEKVGNIASIFTGSSLNLANLVAEKKLGALSYLQSQIPKNPNPPKAFQKDDWKPTKQQQTDFLEKVRVVNNPMVVWQKYQDHTISTLDRDTLRAVYPKIYGEMVNSVMQAAYDPRNKPLNYNDRMQLSQFTGIPFDNSIKNLQSYQQAVSSPSLQQSAPPTKHRASSRPKLSMPSTLSSSDARLYSGSGHNRK